MRSYTFLRAPDALTCALPPGGLSVQLVGRLAQVDAEEAYAELATAPPSLDPTTLLALQTHLIPAEDLPPPPAYVHLLGLLQDKPTAAPPAPSSSAGSSGGSGGSGSGRALLRVLRVDVLRSVAGVDLALLESTLQARAQDPALGLPAPAAQ